MEPDLKSQIIALYIILDRAGRLDDVSDKTIIKARAGLDLLRDFEALQSQLGHKHHTHLPSDLRAFLSWIGDRMEQFNGQHVLDARVELPPDDSVVVVHSTETGQTALAWLCGPDEDLSWHYYQGPRDCERLDWQPTHWSPIPDAFQPVIEDDVK